MPMTQQQLHRLMSLADEAINQLSKSNYSQSVLLKKKFDAIQDELYGKPIE